MGAKAAREKKQKLEEIKVWKGLVGASDNGLKLSGLPSVYDTMQSSLLERDAHSAAPKEATSSLSSGNEGHEFDELDALLPDDAEEDSTPTEAEALEIKQLE